MKKFYLVALILLIFVWSCQNETPTAPEQTTNNRDYILAKVNEINKQLAEKRSSGKLSGIQQNAANLMLNEMHFYTVEGKPPIEDIIVLSASRWVAFDDRRLADGDNLTWLVDRSDGHTNSGLSSVETTNQLNKALNAFWRTFKQTGLNVELIHRTDKGADPDFFDSLFGFGSAGDPFLADIVQAGWLSGAFFDAVGGPGGKEGILAFAVSFIFVDDAGVPTDIDNNGRLDRALVEVYYNDYFGDPNGTIPDFGWDDTTDPSGLDVQTVGIHENGHSFDVGHIENVPSIMNPVYAGPNRTIDAPLKYNLRYEYKTWPNP